MLITPVSLVHYLLDRSFVSRESLVNGNLRLLDVSRRNLDFKVIRKNGPSYFVKQIKSWTPGPIATIEREANFHWLLLNDPNFQPLAPLAPKCHSYDPDQHILIHELLTGGEDLSEYHQRVAAFPTEIGRLLGETLGRYQSQFAKVFEGSPPADFPGVPPWIFTVHEILDEPSDTLSRANCELIRIVRKHQAFVQALTSLQASWVADTLIHGDMKWENCVLTNSVPGAVLHIVDWEMADWGDGYWDAGAILQAYLSHWIRSLPFDKSSSTSELTERALHPLEALHPAIDAFWSAYVKARDVAPAAVPELLQRSVRYAAARMVQSAFENMFRLERVTVTGIRLLQASFNVLSRPEEAIDELLGLGAWCRP
jgi:hypothetical protein